MTAFEERTIRLGGEAGNVGILTRPREASGPSVALVTAGWLHHVGSNRIHVLLARRLAEGGGTALRFDFSGLGDSPRRADGLPRSRAVLTEGRDAVSRLLTEDAEAPVIVGGVCSGASEAYRIARSDERVDGAILVNPDVFHYRTVGWYLRRYGPSLIRLSAWRNVLRRLLNGVAGGDGSVREEVNRPVDDLVAASGGARAPSREELRQGLRSLVDRGVRLLFVFTGGVPYSHERQFGEMFPKLEGHPRVTVRWPEQLHGASQAFLLRKNQIALAEIVEEWTATFAPDAGRERSGAPTGRRRPAGTGRPNP